MSLVIKRGYFFVKLVFEAAIVQQTRTRDQTFEGVVDPQRPPVLPCLYLVQFWLNHAKSPKHAQKQYFVALLLASGILNSCI